MAGCAGKQEAKQGGKEGSTEQQAAVRWYDARARVALRRVALWLRMPAAKLGTFECMLAQTAQVPALSSPHICMHASPHPCMHGMPA